MIGSNPSYLLKSFLLYLIRMNVGEIPKKYRPEPRIWKMLSTKINGKTLENLSKSRPINKPINISVMVTAEIHRPR